MRIVENHTMSKLRDSILSKLKPKEREVTERIRSALRGQPLEDVLRRFTQGAPSQGQTITEEDLVIGVSKLNANLYLNDVKEFIAAIKQATGSQDNKLPLAETLTLIGN